MIKANSFIILTLVSITIASVLAASYVLINENQRVAALEEALNAHLSQSTANTSQPTSKAISVYMYDEPKEIASGAKSLENGNSVTAVQRNVLISNLYTQAIEEIIKGPTADEQKRGLKPTFGTNFIITLSGNSSCGGDDFQLTYTQSTKTVSVRFCRDTAVAGDTSSSLLFQQIYRTLAQFPEIKQVQVLDKDGNCFDDMRGDTLPAECIFPVTKY